MSPTIWKVLSVLSLIHLCGANKKWHDLRVRYSLRRSEGYYKVPNSTRSVNMKTYVKVKPEAGFDLPLDFYCQPNDPRVCFMYDRKGNVVGSQTSFLKADVDNVDAKDYNYSAAVNFIHTNFFNIPAYSFRVYFTNPEKLTNAGRQNISETADGLWAYIDGELLEVPRYQPEQLQHGEFYKQGCVRSMGTHYFFKLHKNQTDCGQHFPFFGLYDDGSLVGYGLAGYGEGSEGPKTNWYEHSASLGISIILESRPSCMDRLVRKYGFTTTHVYLVKEPWNIGCNFIEDVINTVLDWIPSI